MEAILAVVGSALQAAHGREQALTAEVPNREEYVAELTEAFRVAEEWNSHIHSCFLCSFQKVMARRDVRCAFGTGRAARSKRRRGVSRRRKRGAQSKSFGDLPAGCGL